MKTTFTLAAVLLLSGTAAAQQAQPDSMRVHIIENKNGQLLEIDTVFPASGHAQFEAWLQAQGIELPPPPPPGGNPVFFEQEIEGEPGARHAHPPHPPLPPMAHGDSLHHVMIIREMHEGDSTMVFVRTHDGKQGEPLLRDPAGRHMVIRKGDSAQCRQMHREVLIIDGDTTNGKKVQKVIIVHPAPPVPPAPPVAPGGEIPPVPPVPPLPPVPAEQKKQDGQKQAPRVAPAGELMTVFPNPSTGNITLTFELPGKGKTNIRITDLNGKTVYEEQLGEAYSGRYTKDIDLSKYGKGIYMVEVRKADNVLVKKVVVE